MHELTGKTGNFLSKNASKRQIHVARREDHLMRKLAFVILPVALLVAAGCATKEYVKTQTDPLSERLGRIESRLNAIDAKLAQPPKEAELSQADRAALEEAKATAKKALDAASKAEADAAKAAGDAAKAEAAAKRAEDAAAAAEKAAAKAEKMFRLEQKK